MKGTDLELIATLSGAAATIISASVGTGGDVRQTMVTTATKLLERIDSNLAPQPPAGNQASPANSTDDQAEPGVTVGESYLKGLEQDRVDLRRLVALIGLHDGTVAIHAQAATSALTAEIGELIAKHKA